MGQQATIPVDTIHGFMVEVFTALGTPPEEARICADVLIASDLRGIESHGTAWAGSSTTMTGSGPGCTAPRPRSRWSEKPRRPPCWTGITAWDT